MASHIHSLSRKVKDNRNLEHCASADISADAYLTELRRSII